MVEMVDVMVLLIMLATLVLTPDAVPHQLNTCGTAHHPILVVQCSSIFFDAGDFLMMLLPLPANLSIDSLAFPIYDAGNSRILSLPLLATS